MRLKEIWAKSNGKSLLKHTDEALGVFSYIRKIYPKAPEICGIKNFWELLFISVFLHDIGKCASGFQESLRKNKSWNYRHEILSSSFVSLFSKYSKLEKTAIALAIISHHKSLDYIRSRYATFPFETGKNHYNEKMNELEVNINPINDFLTKITSLSKKYLGQVITLPTHLSSIHSLEDAYEQYVLPNFIIPWEDEEFNVLHGNYGKFLKGFTTACDHLSSGGISKILTYPNNIKNVYNFKSLRTIQKQSMTTRGNAILISPTGSGKTEASLFWADCNQNRGKTKRVYYLLPFTTSINAMYERFVRDFKNSDVVGLIHGKASYYFYKTLAEDNEYEKAVKFAKEIQNLTKKIYKPLKVMTPFQLLKPFFSIKGFEQQISEMVNGLFIIDEIHAYDPHTTALIIEALRILYQDFRANCLVMSATIPSFLKELLMKELKLCTEIKPLSEEIRLFSRHKVTVLEGDITSHFDIIKQDIKAGKRVLVTCNTISRAQDVFEELSEDVKESALLHSKFILRDREKIEANLKNTNLLVGTQVIEVSLNISYDILYSEPAPIDALIQRFGRVNRMGWERKKYAPVYVFSEGSHDDKHIYSQELVKKTVDNLKRIGDSGILFEDLVQKLVDDIYEKGYDDNQMKEFEIAKSSFQRVYSNNIPFIDKPDLDFYRLFQSYEVVPYRYKIEYLDAIETKKYFEAMSFTTNISAGQFNYLKRKNKIISDKGTHFVDLYYDTRLGLILRGVKHGANII